MCAQLEQDLRGISSKEPQGVIFSTKEQVLSAIASSFMETTPPSSRDLMETTPPSSRDEHDYFLAYLERIGAVLNRVSTGSVIITMICTSLEILEVLWKEFNTGHMEKVAQNFLITDDVIREFGDVKITVTILEEEYKACRAYFLKLSGKP